MEKEILYIGQILEVCTLHPASKSGSSYCTTAKYKGMSMQPFNRHARMCVRKYPRRKTAHL